MVKTPSVFDESIVSADSAADAIAIGACAIVNVQDPRVGGYLEARRVHDVCLARGVPGVSAACMLETGLGRAGNLALAALSGFTLPGDTSASGSLLPPGRHATRSSFTGGGCCCRSGSGLGVDVDVEFLDSVTDVPGDAHDGNGAEAARGTPDEGWAEPCSLPSRCPKMERGMGG